MCTSFVDSFPSFIHLESSAPFPQLLAKYQMGNYYFYFVTRIGYLPDSWDVLVAL